MTVKVAGVWEQGWIAPINEWDLWNFPLRDYGVDEFVMSPISGIDRKVTEMKNVAACIDANPNLAPVFFDEEGEVELADFEHPEDVLYIFGRASFSPWKALGCEGTAVVLPTRLNAGLLWPHQAACIVLHDRLVKDGSHSNR
jgi:hypothetical protein